MRNFAKLFIINADGSQVVVVKKNKPEPEEYLLVVMDGTDDLMVERTFVYDNEEKRDKRFADICQADAEVLHRSLLKMLQDMGNEE